MVRAWYRGHGSDDKAPLMPDPPAFVSLEEVMSKTGIVCLKFSSETWDTDKDYAALKESRGYNYEDTCEVTRDAIPNYDQVVKNFSTEHLHADEEVRFIVAGTGFFDIRDWDDRWIRLEATKDDLLILPAGIYHRFVMDSKDYVKVKRLFSGTPCWTAFYRPEADDHPARKEYLARLTELRQTTYSK